MKAKRLSKDMISNLPSAILENILCLVPLKDAVRTGILSRNWRYVWTNIPKLVFDEKDMFENKDITDNDIMKRFAWRCKVFYAIHQVLSLHQAPISEFTLSMEADETCGEIGQIITYLSRNNTLKKFTLNLSCNFRYMKYRLPSSIFSLHQLTDLYLSECYLVFDPTFSGFGSLTSLYLNDVNFCRKTLLHLMSICPLLKTVSMILQWEDVIQEEADYYIEMLLEYLFSVEHLTLCVSMVEVYVQWLPRELRTPLIHLKSLCLYEMEFIDYYEAPFVFLLIRSSPNLEKLELQFVRGNDIDPVMMDEYSDIWLEHLNELVLTNFPCSRNEIEFLKLILAKSPVLKKVNIFLDDRVSFAEEMLLLIILSQSPNQSNMIKVYIERY